MKARDIATLVCLEYGIGHNEMFSNRRAAHISGPRQIAYFLTYHMTNLSYPEIGHVFGRDHTSIMHGVKRVDEKLARDRDLRKRVARLMDEVRNPICEGEAMAWEHSSYFAL
jgi:chromosomal replication initiator protein